MSKLETVKGLAASSQQQLQIVQTIQQLQQSMTTLPEAVASETASALQTLETLRQDVRQVLSIYDQVTKHQRDSLDELTAEMTRKAAQAFDAKAQSLHAPLGSLEGKTKELADAIQKLTTPAKQIAELPQKLTTAAGKVTSAAENLDTSARTLREAAESLRPPLWKRLLTLAGVAVLAGAVGAVLAGIGQAVSAKLVPPSADQQTLESFRAIWSRATQEERELMRGIARRPAK